MTKYSAGKYAKFISDRSGMEFPYVERVTEWDGTVVHTSEYEKKHPQLEPPPPPFEPQSLYQPRPARKEPFEVFVGQNVFPLLENSSTQCVCQIGVVGVVIS
tara:strand:+ start:147 stop:452 length:306 start_codon:yes stop_codon:yes gene_type:complete